MLPAVSLLNGGIGVRALGQPAHPLGSMFVTNIGSFGLDEGYVAPVPLARVPLYVCVGAVSDAPMAVDGQVVHVDTVQLPLLLGVRVRLPHGLPNTRQRAGTAQRIEHRQAELLELLGGRVFGERGEVVADLLGQRSVDLLHDELEHVPGVVQVFSRGDRAVLEPQPCVHAAALWVALGGGPK